MDGACQKEISSLEWHASDDKIEQAFYAGVEVTTEGNWIDVDQWITLASFRPMVIHWLLQHEEQAASDRGLLALVSYSPPSLTLPQFSLPCYPNGQLLDYRTTNPGSDSGLATSQNPEIINSYNPPVELWRHEGEREGVGDESKHASQSLLVPALAIHGLPWGRNHPYENYGLSKRHFCMCKMCKTV